MNAMHWRNFTRWWNGGNLTLTGGAVKKKCPPKTARAGRCRPGSPSGRATRKRAQYSNCIARRRPQRHGSQPSRAEISMNTPQAA